MKYEYDFEVLDITEQEKQMIQMNMIKVEDVNLKIKDILNKRASNGWEPFYPFSVPNLWFRKPKKSK